MAYEILKQAIETYDNIVFMSGINFTREIGIPNFRDDKEAYEVELSYGYSPEDLYSTAFYSTRPDLFYRYYKDKILYLEGKPNDAYYALSKLEEKGKLKAIITRSIYSIHKMAGSKNVIELHGNIHKNTCIHCGAQYSAEYIKNSHGIPKCEKCQSAIRPGVSFYGDMIDNGRTTQAADAICAAEMLIVAGTHLDSYLAKRFLQYFKGDKLVLINDEEHYSDINADIVIHDKVSNVLPQVID